MTSVDESDPEWCPECESMNVRVEWSDESDRTLTSVFLALQEGEMIQLRRYCRRCNWREVRQFSTSITKQGKSDTEQTSESTARSLDELFNQPN